MMIQSGAASEQAIQQSTQQQLSQQEAKQQDATQQESPQKEQLINMPLTGHLIELRRRLARILGLVIVLFFILLPFANQLYEGLSQPLRAQLPANATMIATDVTATFMAPFKLNLFVAFMLAIPYIIYQIWSFIKPALYEKERHLAIPLLFGSIVLFYLGVAFAYFITLPAILHFFISASPESVAPMTDINSYLGFCLKLFLVFGFTFEIPIVTLLLILMGLVSTQTLVEKRRFIVVGCFFVAMFVTPPDALSMIMLAVPMWMLFELGLLLGKILEKRKAASTN